MQRIVWKISSPSLSLSLSLKCGGKKFVGVMDACRGEGLPIYTNYKDPHHLRRSPRLIPIYLSQISQLGKLQVGSQFSQIGFIKERKKLRWGPGTKKFSPQNGEKTGRRGEDELG